MAGLRTVGGGRIVGKTGDHWVIDRDGVAIYIAQANMLAPRPAIGVEGVLTYEHWQSHGLVNCFRVRDDPLLADSVSPRQNSG